MTTTPSFLFKRGSIYYFQVRIPENYSNPKNFDSNRILRRSTRTGNRREALQIARKWWIQLMENDFKLEDEINFQQKMYEKGKELYKEFSQIDQNDSFAWNNFTIVR